MARSLTKDKKKIIIWVIVLSSIALNIFAIFLLYPNTYPSGSNSGWLLWPFRNVRYGYYLARRLFLAVIAFGILVYWLIGQKKLLKFIKENSKYLIILLLTLVVVRLFSFGNWFYLDDYRFLSDAFTETTNLQGIPCCGEGYPAMGIMYLVMRWFGTNFTLYNALGLAFLYLTAIVIFLISEKIQKDKTISLLASLFFVTLPTYFHMTLAMQEFTGDTFSMLLFATSVLLLLHNFIPGSLIFAAAALEFGLSRTHIIGLPLILLFWFFVFGKNKITKNKRRFLITPLAFFLISVVYYPMLSGRTGAHKAPLLQFFTNPDNLLILLNMIPHITLPYLILHPLVYALDWLFYENVYISPILGIAILTFLALSAFYFFLKKRGVTWKLITVGLSIIFLSVIFPPAFGVRVINQIKHFTEYIITSREPMSSTGYGMFPALGLVLIFLAYSKVIKRGKFKKLAIALIIINSISTIQSYRMWNIKFGTRQRTANKQLLEILPNNDKTKLILVADPTSTFQHEIRRFLMVYIPASELIIADTPEEFIEIVDENNLPLDQIHLIKFRNETLKATDLSDDLRKLPKNEWVDFAKKTCPDCKLWLE